MKTFLKMKIKSLAAETRIIHSEERKWPGQSDMRQSLYHHRKTVVQRESRASQLAYGFLRGRDYKVMESKCHELPDWAKVEDIALRFGKAYYDQRELKQRFAAWKDAGVAAQ